MLREGAIDETSEIVPHTNCRLIYCMGSIDMVLYMLPSTESSLDEYFCFIVIRIHLFAQAAPKTLSLWSVFFHAALAQYTL